VSDLPNGWVSTHLGELLTLKYGKALPDRFRSGAGFPVYGSNGEVGLHETPLTAGETIIVGRKGSVGEVHYSSRPCSPIDTTYYVDDFSGSPARYWMYQLRDLHLRDLNKSTAIPGLNREDAYRLVINVPPVAEQQRIAKKIDSVLANVDECRARLDRVPQILKKFREAVLEAAVSGRLTEEWRGAQGASATSGRHEDIPFGWVRSHFDEITDSSLYGPRFSSDDYISDGVPTLRTTDMDAYGHLTPKDPPRVKISKADLERLGLKDGDLVMTRTGATIGKCAVYDASMGPALPSAYLIRFRLKQQLALPRFALLFLLSPVGQRLLFDGSTSFAQPNINAQKIRTFRLSLPSLPEQTEIVRRVDELFVLADRLESRHADTVTRIQKLTPSVLAKAFRGELVPQDSNDESAETLLARIRQGQASEEAASIPSRKNTQGRVARRGKIRGGRRLRARSA
jgi:type I restriction enzyme, S subunit